MNDARPETVQANDQATIVPESTRAVSSESPTSGGTAHLPRFDDYEILEEVARGGMGVVYRAKQKNLDRIVAVKMMLSGQYASGIEVERFQAEATAAAQLDHPGIVPIYEVGETGGHRFFSMAFVEGESLDQRLAEGEYRSKQAAELLAKIADALVYAHEQGIVHRDLKPGNIMIDRNGEPRITDFGLAKRLDGTSQLTATGQTLGTPSYMAPEQAIGKPDAVGPSADIYALGAILYAMLAGKPPFISDTPMSTMMMVLERDPTPLRSVDADIDVDLETICLKCLEKKPDDRYATAADLAADLRNYLSDKPISVSQVKGVRKLLKWYRAVRNNHDVRIESQIKFGSFPLVSIAFGKDLEAGEESGHAKGVFAIGDVATGVFAYGGTARGVFAFGAKAYGVLSIGAFSVGLIACGALAIGPLSLGGLSIGGVAMGLISIGYTSAGFVTIGKFPYGGFPIKLF